MERKQCGADMNVDNGEDHSLPTSDPRHIGRPSDIQRQHTRSLLRLPNELLHYILSYLPWPAQLSLQHVCRDLYGSTPSLRAFMAGQQSLCEQNVSLRANEENSNQRSGKRRCVTCGQLAPSTWFRRDTTPICKWHDGWFMKRGIPDTLELDLRRRLHAQSSNLDCWASFPRRYCAHSKEVINWTVRNCNCRCEFCGHFEVTCYVRISRTEGQGLELDLVEGEKGLEIRETKRQDSPFGRTCERMVPVVALSDL